MHVIGIHNIGIHNMTPNALATSNEDKGSCILMGKLQSSPSRRHFNSVMTDGSGGGAGTAADAASLLSVRGMIICGPATPFSNDISLALQILY